MTNHVIDIDENELRAAQAASGFTTIEDTVAAGLRELIALDARRGEIRHRTVLSLAEIADEAERDNAWRQSVEE